jgi:hypothetical protein
LVGLVSDDLDASTTNVISHKAMELFLLKEELVKVKIE